MRSLLPVTVVSCACIAGCSYTITPPATVADPVTVYIADLGNTSKLILPREPTPDGRTPFVEYGFGDWAYYAKDNHSPLYAPIAILFPTPGTLSRRAYDEDPATWLDGYAEELHPITVEREKAAALERRLTARYESRINTEIYNPTYDLHFVYDEEDYWLFGQSSSVVADWSRELGCRVTGWTLVASYRVKPPRD